MFFSAESENLNHVDGEMWIKNSNCHDSNDTSLCDNGHMLYMKCAIKIP